MGLDGTDFWSYRPTGRRNLEAASGGYDQAPLVGFDRTLNDPRGCRGWGENISLRDDEVAGRSPFVFSMAEEVGSTKAKQGYPPGEVQASKEPGTNYDASMLWDSVYCYSSISRRRN